MFNRKITLPQPEGHQLDETIENLISELSGAGPDEQAALTKSLDIVWKLRAADRETLIDGSLKVAELEQPPGITPDVLISAGASVISILAILLFEKNGIITSKSFGLLPKIKI